MKAIIENLHTLPPTRLLHRLQELFQQWGIYKQRLIVNHEGENYLIACDEEAFVVYRLLPAHGKSPGAPGWPVCLLTANTMADECSPPHDGEDHFASRLSLADWLVIIEEFYGKT
ncbi:hypothetical protein [Desulfobacca acetoxidans]|uniref:Uncharacterized protein n=1 Tax=Desulfobacca acetoxidans (strain ATCC 700848 / DSM 11109 / ASRB2) TaxID=880072 RepID=F2NII7_DESAR|nr:hypothetical protein [Desulfobacca acetoxidans]AEB10389.1 hypothetical protein Desac_2571 [Desulfobacca acetoxidans DSM 11109]